MYAAPPTTVTKAVSDAVKAVGGRLFGRSYHEAPVVASSELARYGATIQSIRDVMLRHVIEPNPANYELVYRYVIAHEPRLEDAMDELIRSGYAPAAAKKNQESISHDDLTGIVDNAQVNLRAIEAMVRQSTSDTKGFGDALEGNAKAMADVSDPAISSLIALTRTMIEKTRAAEQELRERSKAMSDLKVSLTEAQVKADTDVLTGISNRRAFERMLGAAGARAVMTGEPLSLAICDIDHFKIFNDTHGHEVGDRVLRFVSNVLQENCSKIGSVFRHGGEEFVVIFERMTAEQAYEVIDATRRDLGERHIVNKETDESIGTVSFSAGVSLLGECGDVGHLLRNADRALYRAKANGRNCVVISDFT